MIHSPPGYGDYRVLEIPTKTIGSPAAPPAATAPYENLLNP